MTAIYVSVLLLVAFITGRIFRSTTIWWISVLTIVTGLLFGMLGANATSTSNKKKENQITQMSYVNAYTAELQSSVTLVTIESSHCLSGVAGFLPVSVYRNILTSPTTGGNGRDSPAIEDDS